MCLSLLLFSITLDIVFGSVLVMFLTREPQGFLWLASLWSLPQVMNEEAKRPVCCWQSFYDPKNTNNSIKRIK